MNALNLKDVLNQRIKIIENEAQFHTSNKTYQSLLEIYDICYEAGLSTKHSSHDSIFYIMRDTIGFRVIKFYNDCSDYRTAYFESSGIAYSMAFHAL